MPSTHCHGFLFVFEEFQPHGSNDGLDLNRKRRSSNKLVIVSDDEGDSERTDKDVCSKDSSCNGRSFSRDYQDTGLSVAECQFCRINSNWVVNVDLHDADKLFLLCFCKSEACEVSDITKISDPISIF